MTYIEYTSVILILISVIHGAVIQSKEKNSIEAHPGLSSVVPDGNEYDFLNKIDHVKEMKKMIKKDAKFAVMQSEEKNSIEQNPGLSSIVPDGNEYDFLNKIDHVKEMKKMIKKDTQFAANEDLEKIGKTMIPDQALKRYHIHLRDKRSANADVIDGEQQNWTYPPNFNNFQVRRKRSAENVKDPFSSKKVVTGGY